MTGSGYAQLCAAAVFYALDRSVRARHFQWPAKRFSGQVLAETLELLSASALLTALYVLISAFAAEAYDPQELSMILFWPASFVIAHVLRRPTSFFIALFLACSACAPAGDWNFSMMARAAGELAVFAAGVGLFRWLMAGLEARLVFMDVPKSLSGLPVLLLLAFFISLGGWGLLSAWNFIF